MTIFHFTHAIWCQSVCKKTIVISFPLKYALGISPTLLIMRWNLETEMLHYITFLEKVCNMIGGSRIYTNFAICSIFDIGLLSINFLVIKHTQSKVSTTSKGKGYSCAEYIPQVGKQQVLLRT